jgi:hypothetical protein
VPDDEDEELAVESMTDEFVEAAGEELQFSSPSRIAVRQVEHRALLPQACVNLMPARKA